MEFLPELMTHNDGTLVTAETWQARRREIINTLAEHEYGFMPEICGETRGKSVSRDEKCCSGHAALERIEITVPAPKGDFTFPVMLFTPKRVNKAPVFVLINFRPDPYDMYFPAEEIIDNGFAIAVIHYNDVTMDNADMSSGMMSAFNRNTDGTGYGKISMWAFAASRVLDYLQTRTDIDAEHACVIGHSRLGKTALWCGANDTRFKYVVSNDSGCSGAAYERRKHPASETIAVITKNFPYWFCENFRSYVGREDERPFDQHWLLAACAPRYLIVHSASEDLWADPLGEQESCIGASPAWEINGVPGYIGPVAQAEIDVPYDTGCVEYMRRDGVHFLGRADWLDVMEFIKKHP